MRLVSIDRVQAGEILGRSVYDHAGRILLKSGTALTSYYIKRLVSLGYHHLYIENLLLDDVVFQETIKESTKLKALKCFSDIVRDLNFQQPIDEQRTQQVVKDIIDDLLDNKEILINLTDIQCHDAYTYSHSVNVAIISLVVGIALKLRKARLEQLGVGALLHDVGKSYIPTEILSKPGSLTPLERQKIERHCEYGYQIVTKSSNIPPKAARIVWQHHERVDGTGYPLGLNQNDIDLYSRVVAVADVYEALTSHRSYRPRYTAHEAYEYIMGNAGTHFDMQMVEVFVRHIALYPTGAYVILSNGQNGYVVGQNRGFPSRPVVRVFWEKGRELPAAVEYDLLQNPDITIIDAEE